MVGKMVKINGVVQHYSWGGREFIPRLLHIGNEKATPFAEYWLGAHPNHPSRLQNSNESLLAQIEKNKIEMLGATVTEQFQSLPFLLKILDVAQMLSIQVHPSKASAAEGYENENEKDISLTAPHRNYKDENHKPEALVALGDFWLLHGFKNETDITVLLNNISEFNFLSPVFKSGGYQVLYEKVMTMPQQQVNHVLQPIIDRIAPLYRLNQLEKSSPDFWAARAAEHFCKAGKIDRGIFSIYFFNLLHLKKGQAIYQPEGLPHAYLEGQNIEVMANSDNVLRAGLTNKHIDVAELMKHVIFEATYPQIIAATETDHQQYKTPAKEFELHRYFFAGEKIWETTGPEIILLLAGQLTISDGNYLHTIMEGEALFIKANATITATAGQQVSFFRVIVP